MLSETLPLQTCWVCRSWDGAAVTHIRSIAARAFFMVSSGRFLRSYYLEKIGDVKAGSGLVCIFWKLFTSPLSAGILCICKWKWIGIGIAMSSEASQKLIARHG